MKKLVVMAGLAVLIMGCAPRLTQPVQHGIRGLDGNEIRITTATSRDRWGTEVVGQLWQTEGKEWFAQGHGPGVFNNMLQGSVAGAELGAGLGAGMAAQGATKVTQNSGGGNAVNGPSTSSASAAGGAGGLGGAGGAGGIGIGGSGGIGIGGTAVSTSVSNAAATATGGSIINGGIH